MSLPTFLVIGAAKSGTTSLHDHLAQHPDVFVPELKEPRFFAFEGREIDPQDSVNRRTITDFGEYKALFREGTGFDARGEASPAYLSVPGTAHRIHRRIPDVRLIALLRNPVERAWSHFLFAKQMGFEPGHVTFEEALQEPEVEVDGFLRERSYFHDGCYARLLEPYLEIFPRDRLLLLLFDDLVADPQAVAKEVYRFIGVRDDFRPSTERRLARTGEPRNDWLHRLVHRSSGLKAALRPLVPSGIGRAVRAAVDERNLRKPDLDEGLRRHLVEAYREDVTRLEGIVGRDLSHWVR